MKLMETYTRKVTQKIRLIFDGMSLIDINFNKLKYDNFFLDHTYSRQHIIHFNELEIMRTNEIFFFYSILIRIHYL